MVENLISQFHFTNKNLILQAHRKEISPLSYTKFRQNYLVFFIQFRILPLKYQQKLFIFYFILLKPVVKSRSVSQLIQNNNFKAILNNFDMSYIFIFNNNNSQDNIFYLNMFKFYFN